MPIGTTVAIPDIAVIATCNKAIALLERVRGWGDGTVPCPADAAMNETQRQAWDLTRQAMAAEVSTLAGARAQVALLLLHHEFQGSGPEHPAIELPALRNLLRLLPAA